MRRQDERHARHAGPCCLNQAETTVDSSLRGSGGERPILKRRAGMVHTETLGGVLTGVVSMIMVVTTPGGVVTTPSGAYFGVRTP